MLRAPPGKKSGDFHEPQEGLKFWRKGSNIDVRTGAVLFFFFCLSERLVMYDRRLVPILCVWKIDQKIEKKKFFAVNFDYV